MFEILMNSAEESQPKIKPPPKFVAGIFRCQQNATLRMQKERKGKGGRGRLINNSDRVAVQIELLV